MKSPSNTIKTESQQQKHQNNVSNLFKVNYKDTGTTSMTSLSLMLTLNRFHTLF